MRRRRRAGKDKGRLVSLQQENLAGRQRVSEPGNAIKSRGSRSSSAPHLSGRHAITGFVYMGLCTTRNLEKIENAVQYICDVYDEQLPCYAIFLAVVNVALNVSYISGHCCGILALRWLQNTCVAMTNHWYISLYAGRFYLKHLKLLRKHIHM